MTKDELWEMHKMNVERYGTGYLLADYSGKRGEASYCGISREWRRVAVVRDPFPDVESAITAGVEESLS